MDEININAKKELDNGWEFVVQLDGTEFVVHLEKDYWKKLAEDREDPEELIVDSFKFLLEREPKDAILREFNLKVIKRYFPEYEREIKNG